VDIDNCGGCGKKCPLAKVALPENALFCVLPQPQLIVLGLVLTQQIIFIIAVVVVKNVLRSKVAKRVNVYVQTIK